MKLHAYIDGKRSAAAEAIARSPEQIEKAQFVAWLKENFSNNEHKMPTGFGFSCYLHGRQVEAAIQRGDGQPIETSGATPDQTEIHKQTIINLRRERDTYKEAFEREAGAALQFQNISIKTTQELHELNKELAAVRKSAGAEAFMPTDDQIRKAVEAEIQQWLTDSLTPDRGYGTPIDNVKALFTAAKSTPEKGGRS